MRDIGLDLCDNGFLMCIHSHVYIFINVFYLYILFNKLLL